MRTPARPSSARAPATDSPGSPGAPGGSPVTRQVSAPASSAAYRFSGADPARRPPARPGPHAAPPVPVMPEPVLNNRRRVLAGDFPPPDREREEHERSEQQQPVSAISA